MKIKCIAIGNRIMKDDSIGIRVLEELSDNLDREYFEVIIGETDTDYVLSKIDDGDMFLIFDSTCFGIEPGTVTFTPIENSSLHQHNPIYTQHQPNLMYMINIYLKNATGYIIGIEAKEIEFGTELSDGLEARFECICKEIKEFITSIKEEKYA